jgi:uncharacterized damage-inducible protein DinB
MQPLQPEQATFLLHAVALPMLKREHGTTKQIIQAIPLDKGDYRPDPVSRTALEIAWHIVAAEHRFLSGVADGVFDFTPNHRSDSLRNSADIAAWYSKSFEADFQRLTHLSPEQLVKIIDFRGIFQLPAVLYLQSSQSHTIHHRGQLTVYIRPMGGSVPSIYGESYAAAEARKAAQA